MQRCEYVVEPEYYPDEPGGEEDDLEGCGSSIQAAVVVKGLTQPQHVIKAILVLCRWDVFNHTSLLA